MPRGPKSKFAGTERFALRERLGSGAMGVVYRAFDVERRTEVALKQLRDPSPEHLLRFKREFRALADVSHPNLVALYELLSEEEQWFFTMELIQGVDFLSYVRGDEAALANAATAPEAGQETSPCSELDTTEHAAAGTVETLELASTLRTGSPRSRDAPVHSPATAPAQIARLRNAARQLADGVAALHRAGHLHRDLKPSNVLVTPDERVVILDFGVVGDLDKSDLAEIEHGLVVGTPAYMAPEQAAARGSTRASDWYAVGVMLFEALTGQRPMTGSTEYVLACKQQLAELKLRDDSVQPLHDIAPGVPADLDRLCTELLYANPSRRPREEEVLARLRAGEASSPARLSESAAPAVALHGREEHLAALREAYVAVQDGEQRVVRVHGTSGMGKTALVLALLSELRARLDALVLPGRCYECESVPYKALDSLVDELAKHLLELADAEVATLLPRQIPELARLFPVLRQVPAVARAFETESSAEPDPLELRRRAFEAFRELLQILSARHTVILFIDDLQWGELDSADLLEHITRGPNAPPVLLIVAYRREDKSASSILRRLDRSWQSALSLAVDPLSLADSRKLASALLREAGAESPALAKSIARESRGNPFFIQELAGFVARDAEVGDSLLVAGSLGLDEVLTRRLRELDDAARQLLETVALAGRPTPQILVARAAELGDEHQTTLARLRSLRLVRTRGARTTDEIECFHDRIREAAVAQLADARRRECHSRLARVLGESGDVDPEVLSIHFEGSGDAARAAELSITAADRAANALAFDRAAALYARALSLRPPPDASSELSLRHRLADALANARRGPEAAEQYLCSAALHDTLVGALELRRRAAEELLRSGHIDAGLDVLDEVLAAYGMSLPTTPRRALLSLLHRRARVRLRGLRFRERDVSQVPKLDLERIDLCFSVATTQAMLDNICGADFQARSLLLALKTGEPFRIGRSLAMEAAYFGMLGGPGRKRFEKLLARTRTIAEDLRSAYLHALIRGVEGVGAFLRGDWTDALAIFIDAEQIFREQIPGASWELDIARLYRCWSLVLRGDFAEALPRIEDSIREAEDRGDIYAATNLRTTLSNMVWLAADDLDRARREAEAAILQWSQAGFFVQHYYDLLARGNIDLYAGQGDRAYERICTAWPAVRKSLLLRIQYIRVTLLDTRARGALAAAQASAAPATREALLRAAEKDARTIAREKMHWTDPLALLIRGCAAAVRGDEALGLEHLEFAVAGFEDADMGAHAAAARRRAGQLRGGAEGRALVEAADRWLAGQVIERPDQFAAMLAPGLPT